MTSRPTMDDLLNVPGKAELVDGTIVLTAPTGGAPGYAADEIFASLREHARRTRRGRAVGDNKAFRVQADEPVRVYRSTSPDTPTGYRRGDIAEAEPAVPGWRMAVDDLFP